MAEMKVPGARSGTLQDVMEEIMSMAERGRLRSRVTEDWPRSQNVEIQTRAQQQRAMDSMAKDHRLDARPEWKGAEANRIPKRDLGYVNPGYSPEVEAVLQLPVETDPRNLKADQIDPDAERERIRELGMPISSFRKQAKLIYDKGK